MRSVLGFCSLMAGGVLIAAWLTVAGMGPMGQASHVTMAPGETLRLDYPSLTIGLVIGLLLALFARVSWTELPRRLIIWLLANERNFYRLGIAAVLVGVLVFY